MLIAMLRTAILYLTLIAGVRLMGKRQVGELEPAELVLTLLVADLAAVPMQDFGIPLLFGLLPILVLLCLTMILSVLTMKNVRLRTLLCGRPSIVIDCGELLQKEMARTRMTVDELMEELRLQGITDISTVQYAILETNGKLSTILYPQYQPATAEQMGVSPALTSLPLVIISDGQLLTHNLIAAGQSREWLEKVLADRKLNRIEDVFLLSLDKDGKIFYVRKEGR